MTDNKSDKSYDYISNFTLKIFIIFTLLFFIIKSFYSFNNIRSTLGVGGKLFTILYGALFFIFLYLSNLAFTKHEYICGKANTTIAFYSTIIPFLFIFVLFMVLLELFPGWSRSFANTFGLTIAKLSGLDEVFGMIFKSSNKTGNKRKDNIITQIYSNPSLLINELSIEDVEINLNNGKEEINWPQYETIIGQSEYVNTSGISELDKHEIKKKLIGFINLKNDVSKFIWTSLVGGLTIMVSYNTLINENCSTNTMTDREFQNYIQSTLSEDKQPSSS